MIKAPGNEIQGLNANEVLAARKKFGQNEIISKKRGIADTILDVIKEPMVILLFVAALLYLISGQMSDAIFMIAAIVLVTGISLYQETRSRNALSALKTLTQPTCKVIRDGMTNEIKREELVVGDIMIVEEGSSVAADGKIIQSNDFFVN